LRFLSNIIELKPPSEISFTTNVTTMHKIFNRPLDNPLAALYFMLPWLSLCVAAEEISLKGNGFLRYDVRSELYNPKVNRIKVQFRTTHPSGTIVYATGSGGDLLRIDIVQGRLRVLMKRKMKMVNEILIGRKLDDNRWHQLHILRVTRLLNVKLVGYGERIILTPGLTTEFKLNKVIYVGGAGKEVVQKEASVIDNNDQNGQVISFKGCLKDVIIDNKQPLQELRKRNKNLVIYGIVSRPCHADDFNPIQFPNPQSVVDVVRIPSSSVVREMSIKLQFRTFDSEGTFVYAEGNRCHFILEIQKKQVYLELKQDDVLPAKVEIQREINNGLWHEIQVTVTQTTMFLQVDDGTRISASLPKTTSSYQCSLPSRLLIGGGAKRKMKRGFVGCLSKISINGREIDPFHNGEVSIKGPIKQGCRIKDKCFPTPCRNGGNCYQTWHSYGCDCSKTTFYGKHCNIPIYKATCAGYKNIGLSKASNCILDSDGTGRLSPYTASCEIVQGNITTVVHHNKEKTVNVTDGADLIRGSFFHVVDYELTMEQMEALIKKSISCRQFLRFDCYNAALLNTPLGPPNAMWHTRTGDIKSYWGGVPDGGRGCKCGLTRSCLRKDKLCNCDSLNNRWVEDSGFIENKELLPITRMHFTGIHRGFGHVTLGPLECHGSKEDEKIDERPPSEILSQVCMLLTMRKYITNNETKLVWDIPSEGDGDGVKQGIDYYSETQPSTKPEAYSSTRNVSINSKNAIETKLKSNMDYREQTDPLKNPTRSSLNATKKALPKMHEKDPFDVIYRTSEGQELSVLEIILIVFAALSVSVLIVKFVILKAIHFVRRRYQIKRLYLNEADRNTNGMEQPLKCNEPTEFRVKKGVLRKSRNSDWV